MTTFTLTEEYRKMSCSECGAVYFFSDKWCDRAKETGKEWKCPNGHGQWFGESDFDKVKRDRDRLKQQVARAEDETREAKEKAAREVAAAKSETKKVAASKKRLEKRTAAGTCPCCQRTFSNMSTHMRKQHPTFVAEAVEAPKLKVVK